MTSASVVPRDFCQTTQGLQMPNPVSRFQCWRHRPAALPQQLLHDIVVRLRPVPARLQLPAIDDVADQIDDVRFMKAEEIEQALGLTASRSKMYIGYEESAKSPGSFHAHHVASVR